MPKQPARDGRGLDEGEMIYGAGLSGHGCEVVKTLKRRNVKTGGKGLQVAGSGTFWRWYFLSYQKSRCSPLQVLCENPHCRYLERLTNLQREKISRLEDSASAAEEAVWYLGVHLSSFKRRKGKRERKAS